MSSEIAEPEITRAVGLLGHIVSAIGSKAMGSLLEVSEAQWAAGSAGPVVSSARGEQPPYSFTLDSDKVGFRVGEETGNLPLQTLRDLLSVQQMTESI